MYKRLLILGWAFLSLWAAFPSVFATSDSLPTSILELQPLLETHSKLQTSNISSQIPFGFLKKTLEHYCPSYAIKTAEQNLKKLLPERESTTLTRRSSSQLERDFLELKNLYLKIKPTEEALFCEQKYLSLSILESTKNYFEKVKAQTPAPEEQTLAEEKKEKKLTPTEHSSPEPGHHAAPARKIQLIHHTGQLSTSQLKIKPQAEELIQSILQDMQSKNILLAKDMKNLDGKIEIHYLQACKASKGSFHLLTDPQRRNHIFKAIKLQLHLCNKLPSTQQLWKHIQHLLAHELGHYISFFREKDASNFWKICRKGKANICNYKDFNSQYAQTNVDEDYAESFAYRYRYNQDRKSHPAAGSEKLQQKEEYFDKLFSQSP